MRRRSRSARAAAVAATLVLGACSASTDTDAQVVSTAVPSVRSIEPGSQGISGSPRVSAATDRCVDDTEAEWPVTTIAAGDALQLAAEDRLPGLPVPDEAPSEVSGVLWATTPQEYLRLVNEPVDDARLDALADDGFVAAVEVHLRAGPDRYQVQVKHLGGAGAAEAAARADAQQACATSDDSTTVPWVAGVGVLRRDGRAQAFMALGDHEVVLEICSCVESDDLLAVVAEWSTQVALYLTTPG